MNRLTAEQQAKLPLIEKITLAILSRTDVKPDMKNEEIKPFHDLYSKIYAVVQWELIQE